MQNDISNIVEQVRYDTKKSAKGNEYSVLVVKLENGLEIENFVDRTTAFVLKTLSKQAQQ